MPNRARAVIRRGDIKRFREYLNALLPQSKWKGNIPGSGQRTRLYGDYLYTQDRDKFFVDLEEWLHNANTLEVL